MAISKDKKNQLASLMKGINKKFGDNSVNFVSDIKEELKAKYFTSPSCEFNMMLYGGIGVGKITEFFGPESSGKTSMAIEIIKQEQDKDPEFVAGWFETEGSITAEQLEKKGVDMDRLIYWDQKKLSAEEGLDILRGLVESSMVNMIVVNSVAGLVPNTEITNDLDHQNIGTMAKLMSKLFRVITGVADKNKTSLVFINQIREKVGVMFGCLHADTLVNFTDGRSIPIRKVVENKIKGKVWSYNEYTNKFEEKEIIDWHYNGKVNSSNDYIHIEAEGAGGQSTRFGFTVTRDHNVLTNNGWKKAKDITLNDMLVTKYKSIINDSLEDFLWGMFVGDSTIHIRSNSTANIKLQDNENINYLNWKLSKLPKQFNMHKCDYKKVKYESDYMPELAIIKQNLNKRDPLEMLNNHYSPIGLAIWYMDDGYYDCSKGHDRASISIKRFKNSNKIIEIKDKLNSLGFECNCTLKDGSIRFNRNGTEKLFSTICKYVPKCMQYKLSDKYKNKYEDFTLSYHEEIKKLYVPIIMIRKASEKQMKQKGKYDLTIEGNHNYLVGGSNNGIIVHNSPETTTGGRALAFYATTRVRFSRVKLTSADGIKEEEGVKIHCKVYKNRLANGNPYKSCDYVAKHDTGIDSIVELPTILEREEIIAKSGAWYYYPSKDNIDTIGGIPCKFNGKASLIKALNDNEELRNFFKDKIENIYNNSKSGEHLDAEEIKSLEQENNELEDDFEKLEEVLTR